jgi:DNA-binding NarL/FixJ family response regulator
VSGRPGAALSRREREVLELTRSGHSVRAIAARLGIGAGTVSVYRIRVMDKLEVPYEDRRDRIRSVLCRT